MDAPAPREEESADEFLQKNFQKIDSLIKSMAGSGVEVFFRKNGDWGTGWRINVYVPNDNQIANVIATAIKSGTRNININQIPNTKNMLDQFVNKCNSQLMPALNAKFPGWEKFANISVHASISKIPNAESIVLLPMGTYLGSGSGYHDNFSGEPI